MEQPSETRNFTRLAPVFAALANVGVETEPILYNDEDRLLERDRLVACDGVLVWVDPITTPDAATSLTSCFERSRQLAYG